MIAGGGAIPPLLQIPANYPRIRTPEASSQLLGLTGPLAHYIRRKGVSESPGPGNRSGDAILSLGRVLSKRSRLLRMGGVRNRYYDPDLRRWISPDPIGLMGGPNLYAYVGNDPINYWDPWGLCPEGLVQQGDECVLPYDLGTLLASVQPTIRYITLFRRVVGSGLHAAGSAGQSMFASVGGFGSRITSFARNVVTDSECRAAFAMAGGSLLADVALFGGVGIGARLAVAGVGSLGLVGNTAAISGARSAAWTGYNAAAPLLLGKGGWWFMGASASAMGETVSGWAGQRAMSAGMRTMQNRPTTFWHIAPITGTWLAAEHAYELCK